VRKNVERENNVIKENKTKEGKALLLDGKEDGRFFLKKRPEKYQRLSYLAG